MNLHKKIQELKYDLINSTVELIKIKSVEEVLSETTPFGEGVKNALEYILDLSKKFGFKTVNLNNYVGYAEYGEGEEYIGVLGHLDVVPAGDDWKFDPYSGTVDDGKIYGRGALDDKGPLMSVLYALKAIKDLDIKLDKKVRIIFGTNEETNCLDIPYYLKREKPPILGFTPDGNFPVINGEKGIITLEACRNICDYNTKEVDLIYIKGGIRENMVPEYSEAKIITSKKKKFIERYKEYVGKNNLNIKIEEIEEGIKIKSYGVSAHGSTPEKGINSIIQLISFLSKLNIEGDVGEVISFINDKIGFSNRGEGLNINLKDNVSGNLSLNLGMINITKTKCTISLDIRYPVTFSLEDVIDPLTEEFNKVNIKIQNISHDKPLYFPEDHKLVKTLKDVYVSATGDSSPLIAIGGGTYAKELPNIVAFGPLFPSSEDTMHKTNEYISVEDLLKCCEIYGEAILRLQKVIL